MNKPQIRFKGFEEEWQNHSLDELGEVKMCKRILKSQTSEKGDVPFFKIGTFGKEPDAFISKELFDEYKRLYSFPKVGDILVSAAGTIGRTVVFDGKPAYFQDSNLIWIDNDNSLIDNSFLAVAYPKIRWAISSTTIARIYNDTVRNTVTCAPIKIQEQKKIGDYFKRIDEMITEVEREINRLEKMKQASLQKLFPRPGETTPEIRFAGFTEPWKTKRIDQILSIGNGCDYKYLTKGNIPVFGTGGLMTTVNSYLYDGETVFIGRKGTIDKPYYYKGKFWTVDTLFYTHSFVDMDVFFVYCVFQKINWQSYNAATGVPSLSKDVINSIEISVPTQEEQKAIGEYFRNLDSLLSAKRQKLVKLRNIKQACLDKMFVNTTEI